MSRYFFHGAKIKLEKDAQPWPGIAMAVVSATIYEAMMVRDPIAWSKPESIDTSLTMLSDDLTPELEMVLVDMIPSDRFGILSID